MEAYLLDKLYRREVVIDRFESLIWTERWQEFGDFELVLQSTPENRRLIEEGMTLAINESYRVMTVETIEDKTDSDGKAMITVKGSSLEKVLGDRVALYDRSTTATSPNWVLTGTPGDVAREMFDRHCRTGAISLADRIPLLQAGSIFPVNTLPESTDIITWSQPPENLYSAVQGLCAMYDLGFRLYRNFDMQQLYFDVYSGSDRTTKQTNVPPVVFSPGLENLQNTTQLHSAEAAKNIAYVVSNQGFEEVYGLGVDPDVEGFERKVLLVQAEDLEGTPTSQEITSYLSQVGFEELSKYRAWTAFDGEHSQNSGYKYGTHYNLGDLVELQNVDGLVNDMRVTEQIFSSDAEGDRSYPTLTINQFINPGTWAAWGGTRAWSELTTEEWSNMP